MRPVAPSVSEIRWSRGVEFTVTAEAHALVYAPLSDVTFTGNSNFHGGVVGKTLTMSGNSDVHQDLALPGCGIGRDGQGGGAG